MSVRLTFYDGARCIGGNKILLESDGTSLLLDFGTNFGAEGRFFDEFLRPRSTVGICDLLELGLLPPIEGIYRPDLDLPERAFWDRARTHPMHRRLRVDGLLLSHAHYDHTGYISYLDQTIPIYTGLTTATIAKAMQDTQHGGISSEVCYITPREIKEGLLSSSSYRTTHYEQRRFVLLDREAGGERFGAFWSQGTTSRAMNPCQPGFFPPEQEAPAGNLGVRRFPVDHSIPGAGAFAIRTSAGWIVYTGDLRLHGTGAEDTRAFIREAARLEPLALICEGTHPGKEAPVREEEVCERALDAVRAARGLVIADFGPRNVERLLSFHRIARETGRRLTVTARDAYLLEALHAVDPIGVPDPLADETFTVYLEARLKRDHWERLLMERYLDEAPGQVARAETVGDSPDDYICCFSYYDLHELIDIQPGRGTYIYSSSEAFNEEMHIDMDRLRAWVRHFNLTFAGDPGNRDGRGRNEGFHASGHIHGPGLVEMVGAINPEVLIAVHTESPEWFRSHFEGKLPLVIPAPGETVTLPLAAGRATARAG